MSFQNLPLDEPGRSRFLAQIGLLREAGKAMGQRVKEFRDSAGVTIVFDEDPDDAPKKEKKP